MSLYKYSYERLPHDDKYVTEKLNGYYMKRSELLMMLDELSENEKIFIQAITEGNLETAKEMFDILCVCKTYKHSVQFVLAMYYVYEKVIFNILQEGNILAIHVLFDLGFDFTRNFKVRTLKRSHKYFDIQTLSEKITDVKEDDYNIRILSAFQVFATYNKITSETEPIFEKIVKKFPHSFFVPQIFWSKKILAYLDSISISYKNTNAYKTYVKEALVIAFYERDFDQFKRLLKEFQTISINYVFTVRDIHDDVSTVMPDHSFLLHALLRNDQEMIKFLILLGAHYHIYLERMPHYLPYYHSYIDDILDELKKILNDESFQRDMTWEIRKKILFLAEGSNTSNSHITKYLFNDMILREISTHF